MTMPPDRKTGGNVKVTVPTMWTTQGEKETFLANAMLMVVVSDGLVIHMPHPDRMLVHEDKHFCAKKLFDRSYSPEITNQNMNCKVYVGNLGSFASKHELESAFAKYGPLTSVWIARNPPGFAFIEFEDSRDAEDAVRGLDGTRICGTRVRVEMSNGRKKSEGGSRRPRSRSRSPRKRSLSRSRSRSRSLSRIPRRNAPSRSVSRERRY